MDQNLHGEIDRRRHLRRTVEADCKLVWPSAARFMPARTRDVSASGVLIDVRTSRALKPGDRVDLGLSWVRRAVLGAEQMIEAKVVRTSEIDDRGEQTIALAFEGELVEAPRIPGEWLAA